jgi:STE24 endopeptidase
MIFSCLLSLSEKETEIQSIKKLKKDNPFNNNPMNPWLVCILLIIFIQYVLEVSVALLNLKALSPQLPEEFARETTQDEYAKSQEYTRITTYVSLLENTWSTVLTLVFLLSGGFNRVDIWARSFGFGTIPTGLLYMGVLLFLLMLIGLPFSLYSTFVIENRFGFNKTTVKTFILDHIKSILLAIIIGGPVLALVLWFFAQTGPLAWIYCWIGVVIVSLILQFLAPVLIMPLFNTFTPLADGPLKEAIMSYADQQDFKMQGIFTMDGSKRSTKVNAFFTGLGRFRKIVFYDTLVEKLSEVEIVAVLAHEMGHFKLHHIIKMILASILQTGILFYFLSITINNQGLFDAFGMVHLSIYASLVFFGFLFSPVNLLVSIVFNIFSRRHEFSADQFASNSIGSPDTLIRGLKKLSCANLSNLTPHPFHVFLHYSHPPILERIAALRKNHFSSKS